MDFCDPAFEVTLWTFSAWKHDNSIRKMIILRFDSKIVRSRLRKGWSVTHVGQCRLLVFYVAVNCERAQVWVRVGVEKLPAGSDPSTERLLHPGSPFLSFGINTQPLDLLVSPAKHHRGQRHPLKQTEGDKTAAGVHDSEITHVPDEPNESWVMIDNPRTGWEAALWR